MTRKLIPTLAIAMFTVACGGGAEETQNASEALEEAAQEIEAALEEVAGEDLEQAMEDAMEEAAEEMADAMEEAAEEMADAMEEAAKELEAAGLGDLEGAVDAMNAAMEAAGS